MTTPTALAEDRTAPGRSPAPPSKLSASLRH